MVERICRIYLKHQNLFHYFFLILIIATGAVFRLYNLQSNPIALNQDEAINGYDAYSIANTGRDHHGAWQPQPMLESFGDWTSPLITYITVPFVKIFGLNVWSVRLPVAILGTISIYLFYILAMQLFESKKLALFGAFIWAISPWAISLSRWAIPPSIVPFFLLLFLVLLFDALKSNKSTLKTIRKFVLVGVAAGLLTYTYPTMKLFVPLFLGTICLLFLFFFRKKFKGLFIAGFTCLLFIAPIFILTFSDPGKYNSRYSVTSLAASGENIFFGFILRYIEYFLPTFAFGYGDPNNMHKVPGFSSIPDFLSIFFYMGLFIVLYKLYKTREPYLFKKSHLAVILTGLLFFPVAAALTKDHLMLLRTVHGFVFIIIFTLVGIKFIFEYIKSIKVKQLIAGIMFFLLIMNITAFSVYYFIFYPGFVKPNFNYGLKNTFEYVYLNKKYYDKIIIDKDILQIYFLFYFQYDANLLHAKDREEKFNSYMDGKVEFRDICKCDLEGALKLYRVQDEERIWYSVYESNNSLYVVKDMQYKKARFQF